MNNYKIKLKKIICRKGFLSFFQSLDYKNFKIRRAYWLYGNKINYIRGKHSDNKNDKIILCLNGSCEIKIIKNKIFKKNKSIKLSKENELIYIKKKTLFQIKILKKNTKIIVFASQYY